MRVGRRPLIIVLIVVVLFGSSYAYAWLNVYSLSKTYYRQAEASYRAGKYIEALMGYKDYDAARERYVFRGGYAQVVNIWEDPWAIPRPAFYEQAKTKALEIIRQKFTLNEAQRFLDTYLGTENPYLGEAVLRVAEIYEEGGDYKNALETYRLVIESFRTDPTLVERAKERAAALERR